VSQYDFCLKFRLPNGDFINADAEELPILTDGSEVTIRLRSGARGSPIKNHSHAAIIGGPYPSDADAWTVAARAKRSLLLWAIRNRTGIDLGGNKHPRGAITSVGLQWLERQIGAPVRAAVHGIDVYEHIDGLRCVTINAEVSFGKAAQAFVEQVADAITTPVPMTAKQELASEILSASYFEVSDRSKFVTVITAVEALLTPQRRTQQAIKLVERLIETINGSELDKATQEAMVGSLSHLKQESIGQAGRALATRLLAGRNYQSQSAADFFTFCYNLRSSILHSGTVPDHITDFAGVCATAREFVCDLLIASFAEAD